MRNFAGRISDSAWNFTISHVVRFGNSANKSFGNPATFWLGLQDDYYIENETPKTNQKKSAESIN